jgi:hypothetical protein
MAQVQSTPFRIEGKSPMTADESKTLPPSARTRLEVINWLQLITLLGGLVVGAMALGKKDGQIESHDKTIDKLEGIVMELTRHAVRTESQMIDLTRRIDMLERRP